MTKENLINIAQEVQRTKKPYAISKYDFVHAFDFVKRTSGNTRQMNDFLDEYGLYTEPAFEEGSIYEQTEIRYKYAVKPLPFQLYFIKIKGYKNLKNIFIDFYSTNRYCCLIGLNGSGKSNVIEAISAIFYSLYHIATLKNGEKKYACEFQYEIGYILEGKYYEIVNGRLKDGTKITLEILPKNIIASYSGEDTRLWKQYFKPLYETYCSKMVGTQGFVPPFLFHVGKYQWEIALLTLLYSEDRDVVRYINNLIGNSSCSITFDYKLSNLKKWEGTSIEALIEEFRKHNRYSIEEFRDLINGISFIDQASTLFYCLYKCTTESENQIISKINISFSNKGKLDDLSEGEKKLIITNLMIHILSTDKSLCLLDEPDSHIHISRKEELKQLIETENRYTVVTTHSPIFVSKLEDDNLRWLDNGDNHDFNKLRQLSILSGNTINYLDGAFILSSKNILVTEGKYDGKYLKRAIDIFSKTDNKYRKLNSIAIMQAGGASNAVELYNETLKARLSHIDHLIFLFDYDQGGFDGWEKMNEESSMQPTVLSLFYQHDYTEDKKPARKKDIKDDDTIMVEDFFAEDAYKHLAERVHVTSHKAFRNIHWDGAKSTVDAIKHHIEKKYKDFDETWFYGFKPVLDKLLDVFCLN